MYCVFMVVAFSRCWTMCWLLLYVYLYTCLKYNQNHTLAAHSQSKYVTLYRDMQMHVLVVNDTKKHVHYTQSKCYKHFEQPPLYTLLSHKVHYYYYCCCCCEWWHRYSGVAPMWVVANTTYVVIVALASIYFLSVVGKYIYSCSQHLQRCYNDVYSWWHHA